MPSGEAIADFNSRRQRLTDREFAIVQRYLGLVTEEIAALGLSPQIEHDFDLFSRLRSTVADGFVYPSFDPRCSDLAPDGADALWVRAVTAEGETVATSAARIFQTDDFLRLLQTGALWYRRPGPSDHVQLLEGASAAVGSPMAGAIGHAGGTWVNPAWRGQKLSSLLPRFARALMLRNWAIDHETSLVFEHLAHSSLCTRLYGYERVVPVVDGHFPPASKAVRVYLCHLSRAEALAAMDGVVSPTLAVPPEERPAPRTEATVTALTA